MAQKLFIQRPSENFTQIPNELINDNRFNEYNKYGLYAKLLIISLYQNDARSWTPTRKGEAEKLGVSEATFNNRILPVAKSLGWLSISQDSSRGRNATWSITIPEGCQGVSPGDMPGVSPGDTLYNTILYKTNTSETFEDETLILKRNILEESPVRAITLARKALRENKLELSEIKKLLANHVSEQQAHLSSTPMFAIRVNSYRTEESHVSPDTKIANLWISLREDLTGLSSATESKEFIKIKSIVKNLLKKYSYEQTYWTLTKVVSSSSDDARFLANAPQVIEFFVKKHVGEYRSIREASLRSRDSRAKIILDREIEDRNYQEQLADINTENQGESGRLLRLLNWDD
jgi:hypothetical protein